MTQINDQRVQYNYMHTNTTQTNKSFTHTF